VLSLRGSLQDLRQMGTGLLKIERDRFALVIVDAFYRTLPAGSDENSNATLAELYTLLDNYADALGAAFTAIHHASKGIQSEKAVTDVGAGAGAQARAADTHLVLRPHEEPDVVVLDAAVRSWPPVLPRCLSWSFPSWTPAPDLDPTALRMSRPRRRRPEGEEPKSKSAERPWDAKRFAMAVGTIGAKPRSQILEEARVLGLSDRKADTLLKAALDRE